MTLKEQLYKFDGLDIHSAITFQQSIEQRTQSITKEGSEALKRGDKAFKAIIEELDQMYDDLDRHIAAHVRAEEYAHKLKEPQKDALFRQTVGK